MSRHLWALVFGLAVALATTLAASDWPQWRGPGGDGRTAETGLPVRWDATTNVRWKTALPGPWHSSPVVSGDRVFLTAFRSAGGILSYFWNRGQLLVLAIDKHSGRIVWERTVDAAAIEETHASNAPASPTPVTDGMFVYAYFGSSGLTAFDFDGRQVWHKTVGAYSNEWGSGSSPILYRNLLVLNVDQDGDDFLLALDKKTGQPIWRTSRGDVTRSWSTPYVWTAAAKTAGGTKAAGGDEIVVSGANRVKAYDPADGRELWTVEGTSMWITPTPVSGHGLLYVASKGLVMAIRPGGRGDITRSHVVWTRRDGPYISSPVVVDDGVYMVEDGGVMTCVHSRTGALIWQARLPARGNYYASLLAGDGKIYATSEAGEVTVVPSGPKFSVLGSNSMGERTMASPAVSDGVLYIRSDQHLFAIAAGAPVR